MATDFDSEYPSSIVWYTDGSKNDEGPGDGLYSANPSTELSYKISNHAATFQVELWAIEKCAQLCLQNNLTNKSIIIATDS